MVTTHQFLRGLSLTALLFSIVSSTATRAGDIDTHLTSTYYLARQAGYKHREALLIAKGNWSLDLNGTTTALPLKNGYSNISGDLKDPGKVLGWQDRGQRFHLLASNATEAHANLVQLNRDFQKSTAAGDTRLIQLGQYLHASQDAYFHQADGDPYGSGYGHIASGDHGHAADKVNKNYLAAVRANTDTYNVLKQYRDTGSLPPAPDAARIYKRNSDITTGEMKAIVANEKASQAIALTRAVSTSYDADGELNRERLEKNLGKIWNGSNTKSDPFIPPTYLDANSKFKIDYDGKDANALLPDTSPIKYVMKAYPSPLSGGAVLMKVAVRDPGGNPDPATTPGSPGSTITQGQQPLPASGITAPSTPASGPGASPATAPKAPMVTPLPALTPPGTAPPLTQLPVGPTSQTTISMLGGPKPGGISLSLAAASRLAVNINLDGIHVNNGRLVLGGQPGREHAVDAALFLTAMRAACEPTDPYMSLDPDNGKAWSEEGDRAGKEIWARVKGDFGVDKPVSANAAEGLVIKTVSIRRDYPQVWSSLTPRFPNLKSRLVFRPAWLKETRFGEIMYAADVLLKELGAGVPTLQAGPGIRADKIGHYQSSDLRSVVHGLTESVAALPSSASGIRSARLWFDLAPDGESRDFTVAPRTGISMLDDEPKQASNPASTKLQSILRARGLLGEPSPDAKLTRTLAVSGDTFDLSQVWPQMFVRGHDHATRKDVAGVDQSLLSLAEDVNRRIANYADAYKELRDLTEIFRLYVAAVGAVERDRQACEGIKVTPLLKVEKSQKTLPEHHPTELAFTVAAYTHGGRQGKRVWYYQVNSFNGGVSPRARDFFEKEATLPVATAITREIGQEATNHATDIMWTGKTGRQYVALQLDNDPEFIRTARLLSAFKPTTREMVLAMHPELVALDGVPTARGMLDDDPSALATGQAPASGGLLDDVETTEGRTVVVPSR